MAKVVSLLPEFLDQSGADPDPEPEPNGNGGPETFNAVIVSGAGISAANGTYVLDGQINDKNKYSYGANYIYWDTEDWILFLQVGGVVYYSDPDTEFPWDSTPWIDNGSGAVAPTLTPTNV